jgi:hypothetical protein
MAENKEKYDGSEMDVVDSPPLKMIGLAIVLTIVAFVYAFLWAFLLTP